MVNLVGYAGRDPEWIMLTWANGDGTGETVERRYSSRASAVRAANKLRERGIVALVEHEDEKPHAFLARHR